MRKKIVTGNWKMNKTPSDAVALVEQLKDKIDTDDVDVVLCVPFVSLAGVGNAIKGTSIKLGAQNMHFENCGAYTGEISGTMLKEMGVEYVILGHSERRQYFNETDQTVNKKVHKALECGLTPIVCCGETLVQREAGVTMEKIRMQVKRALLGLTDRQAAKVLIAYEPIWAIGTGKTATAEQAQEIHAFIRSLIADKYGKEVADNTSILYGGSCKPSNAKELFANPDVDGGLIGGAALKVVDFKGIIDAFK